MERSETAWTLGLIGVAGLGPGLVSRLIRRFGSARAVFEAPQERLQEVEGIGPELALRIGQGPGAESLEEEERCAEAGIRLYTLLDPAYPSGLRRLPSPPSLLYVRGREPAEGWEPARLVGLVGTRQPDGRGVRLTRQTAQQLAQAGYGIVSGGALGVDSSAHAATLEVEGETIVVLGAGMRHPYPTQNRPLFRRVVQQGGTLFSEFSLETRPERGNFPRRNRLIAALVCGVVVLQCGRQSGALNTAEHCRRLGVPVLTYPGLPRDPLAAGPHLLLRQGACLVESPEEIVDLLRQQEGAPPRQLSLWEAPSPSTAISSSPTNQAPGGLSSTPEATPPSPTNQPAREFSSGRGGAGGAPPNQLEETPPASKTTPALSSLFQEEIGPEATRLLELIEAEEDKIHIDQLAEAAALPLSQVSTLLLQLELQGWVEMRPGQYYQKIMSARKKTTQ
jgi:DNA processing protein